MNTQTDEKQRAKNQARAQLGSIIELVENLRKAIEEDDDEKIDSARQSIMEDPLSIQVRSDWHSPGEPQAASEFEILLCTGGPACRIIGDLNSYNEPDSATIEFQDWFTPWENYPLSSEEEEIVLEYCQQFYFGQ